ncbi:MAG: winged helix-turn-helix domain-containing protein, partial [Actinobacteria bacterium]|nr:winged helix-turn-helix domain-containing protein [Actinomycetota bacterium]
RSVWGDESADPHAVEVAVGRLRRRLGPAAGGLETVPRRGYRLATRQPSSSWGS